MRWKERRGLGGQLTQVSGSDAYVFGAKDPVDEAHGEIQPGRVLENVSETAS